jgi:hypothetical protein
MVKRFKALRKIYSTFFVALPTLLQVGSLICLFLMIYAVLGMHLFGQIKKIPGRSDGLNDHANF